MVSGLKEWAAVCRAVAAGDQVVLLRKGGIDEKRFGVVAPELVLVPTYLHQKEKQFKPEYRDHFLATDRADVAPKEIELSVWCEVVETFEVSEREKLMALEPLVIFTSETIDERYRFRPRVAVQVIVVRASVFVEPVRVVTDERFEGCRSWLELDLALPERRAVLTQAELDRRVEEVRHRLMSGVGG